MKRHAKPIHYAICALALGAVVAPGCGDDDKKNPTPPAACKPGCEGEVLTYCDEQGKAITDDCSAITGGDGKPATCGYVDDLEDFYCLTYDADSGCGDETFEGRCDGSSLIYCASQEEGDESDGETQNVRNYDCAQNDDGYTACIVAPDGVANCGVPGTKGCGYVQEEGECHGSTLSKCVQSEVETTDCNTTNQKCGLLSDGVTSGCIDGALYKTGTGDVAKEVSGKIVYEKRVVDTSSYANAQKGFLPGYTLTPVSRALVQLMLPDGTEVQRTFTDEKGEFALYLPTVASSGYVVVSASADPLVNPLVVRDCPPSPNDTYPEGCTDELGRAHQWKSTEFSGPTALGQVTLTETSGLAGAFNIFNLMLKGQDFARENFNHGMNPATIPLLVEWKKGFETITSYCAGDRIVLQGVVSDPDEYDDPVQMHELGHFLERAFSESDSPGGDHNGSPTDPRLAFGEGYGTYVGCRIAGSSIYYDSSASGIGVTDLNNTGVKAKANDPLSIKQLISEYVVGEMLWRIDVGTGGNTTGVGATGGQGSAPVFDVLGSYFKDNAKYNDSHGVPGRDFVKFLDGFSCRDFGGKASAATSVLKKVVTTDHAFPYDDFGHTIAPIGACK